MDGALARLGTHPGHRDEDGVCRCGWELGEQAFRWSAELRALEFAPDPTHRPSDPAPDL